MSNQGHSKPKHGRILLGEPPIIFNPHQLVPPFEFVIYDEINGETDDLSKMPEPRNFGTHVPFTSLAKSIKEIDFCVYSKRMDESTNRHNDNLGVNKMGKNIRKTKRDQPNYGKNNNSNMNGGRQQQQHKQPQLYNITKNDFKDIVQQKKKVD
ncbi:hypothetical protein JHK84_027799 [Glycine max]|nr:hypothetical protein JHK84_027799 [Glycine max]